MKNKEADGERVKEFLIGQQRVRKSYWKIALENQRRLV
jgi:hypothetical protein